MLAEGGPQALCGHISLIFEPAPGTLQGKFNFLPTGCQVPSSLLNSYHNPRSSTLTLLIRKNQPQEGPQREANSRITKPVQIQTPCFSRAYLVWCLVHRRVPEPFHQTKMQTGLEIKFSMGSSHALRPRKGGGGCSVAGSTSAPPAAVSS